MTEPTGPNPFADEPRRSSAPAGPNPFADDPRAAPGPAERTWWDTAKDVGQTADDAVRAAANAMTFGMADRLAGLTGGGTDAQVKLSEAARKRSPIASIAGDVGGAVALPGIGGRQLAARMGGGWGARALGYGGEGMVLGAAGGAGNTYTGKPVDYLTNAGWGAGLGGVLGAGMGGVFGPRGGMQSTARTPTTAEQFADKTARYDRLEASPAQYEASALARAADPTEAVMRAQRLHQSSSPHSFQAVNEMRAPPTTEHLGIGAPVSPGDIEFIRKGLNNISPVTGGPDLAAQRYVKQALDNFVRNPPPGAVLPGTEAAAREASALAESAREAHGAYRRGQMFDSMVNNATTSAAGANSGLNFANRMRQTVGGKLRENDKGQSPLSKAHFNDDEIAAATKFARVPRGDATLRYIDRVMGGGGGIGVTIAGVGGGAAGGQYLDNPTWGGTLGVAVPAAGFALRALGNRRALGQVNALNDMVHQRSPLYRERAAAAGLQAPPGSGPETARNIMTQALIQQGYGQTGFEDEPRLRLTVHPDYGTR